MIVNNKNIQIHCSCTKKNNILDKDKITIYNCGPTVYNHVHIGNVRPLIVFDVLYRYLLYLNKNVTFVHNITDVDDKIIAAAKNKNISEKELTTYYLNAYLDVLKILNIKKPIMPKVSDHINDIIEYVQKQVEMENAYVVNGDVYFDIKKIKNYGHVSHKNIDELLNGVRKTNNSNKRYPLDFALWKKTNDGIKWKSPWGDGRPGWHTECCVLINLLIGDHATIHGGGVDLKFPHHENENAQNYAIYKKDIANIWMHVGHVNVDGVKMAKSLNNFVLVKDIINKNNANGLRWFFYKTKYQHPINYCKKYFDESILQINKLVDTLSIVKTYLIANNAYKKNTNDISNIFIKAINDDLNLPNAITEIISQIKQINIYIRNKKWKDANNLYWQLCNELNILGINFNIYNHDKNIKMINEWKSALDNKQYEKADELRQQLQKLHLL